MGEKIYIELPIIVEGRYDKNTLSQIFDARIFDIGGFGVFNSAEKQRLIRTLASQGGIILLCDSDGGGRQIRSFVSSILPPQQIHHAYIPKISGKERRKKHSRSGYLGVEGMDREILVRVLAPYAKAQGVGNSEPDSSRKIITKVDFFLDKLSGAENSRQRRAALAARFDLPQDLPCDSLIDALNILVGYDGYKRAICEMDLAKSGKI